MARRPSLQALCCWLLLVVLAACGAEAPAPKTADTLKVGAGKAAPMAVAVSDAASETDLAVPIAVDDPVRGNRNAYVTIVVFSDFQCPFCSRLETTLEKVRETYGEGVRIVFKNDPLSFHPQARLAAEVGAGVFALNGADAFWRYHDIAFRRQPLIAPDAIRMWAIAAGADSQAIEDGLTRNTWSDKVKRDEELATRLGVNGTPSSYINGVHLSGAQPFEEFQKVIDETLRIAKELESQGVTRDRIYGKMVAASFEAPKPPSHDDDDEKPDTSVWKATVGSSPTRGPATALVTIVEFGDFQCPYCKRVQPTLEQVRSTYGDKVRFVWKDEPLPFHPRALPAAELARFARATKGDAGFFAAHDRLFDMSPQLEDADLEQAARTLGLDAGKAMAAVTNKTYAKGIDADLSLSEDVQAAGTPHFFINGKRLVGAQPFDKFKSVIDAEILTANALLKSGVKPTALYDTIIRDAKHAPEPEKKVVAASTVGAPFRGAANGKVVIQEFSDFQCPFCSRAEPTIDQLLKEYPTQVKVVWRNLPLPMHPDAPLAAEAAREAFVQKGNDGFSKMRERLFQHQAEPEGLKRTQLEVYASEIGLDLKKFGHALDDGTHKAAIEADKKAAADAGISGTPAFVIGPYFVSGAQPLTKFKKVVDKVLSDGPAPAAPTAPAAPIAK